MHDNHCGNNAPGSPNVLVTAYSMSHSHVLLLCTDHYLLSNGLITHKMGCMGIYCLLHVLENNILRIVVSICEVFMVIKSVD